jgi:hypothetical protein
MGVPAVGDEDCVHPVAKLPTLSPTARAGGHIAVVLAARTCDYPWPMPRDSSVSRIAGRRRPPVRDAKAPILRGLRGRGWVWWLSMLWVAMGAGGTLYAFACTTVGCTTNQCTSAEFWLPMYDGEPWVIGAIANLAQTAWPLLAVLLLVAGFVRLRGWRRRNWLRTAAWTGAWVAASC